jgi:hypothetical protein
MSLVKKVTAEERPLSELELLGSWASWREAREEVRTAYRWWSTCATRDRGVAFELYRVALDREGDAASVVSDRVERVRALGP